VADRYRRRDRDVVAQEMWVRDEAGQLIAHSVHHQSFLAEQTSGEVTLRDPASKAGARQEAEPSGEPLSVELRKTFTEAMCNEFFYRSRNYHNDRAASKELGFENTVIGGRMTLSCVTELLTRHFGRGFYLGGRLDVKFTNVLWPNESFTTRGIITGGGPDTRRGHCVLREGRRDQGHRGHRECPRRVLTLWSRDLERSLRLKWCARRGRWHHRGTVCCEPCACT
jgi:acyl dehydratase